MKTIYAVAGPVFLFGFLTALLADDKPQFVNPDKIVDKVSITLGEEFTIEFNRDGDRLLKPAKSKGNRDNTTSVKVKLDETSASPVPPPRKKSMRPFLSVENNFENTLYFRALLRMKGSKEFLEITQGIEPLPAGEAFNKCWDFDTFVEEVVLFEFKLSDKPAK